MSENLTENGRDTHGVATTVTDDRDEPLSTAVIETVAEAADADPAKLGTRLYDRIDPDALDNLFGDRHNGMARGSGYIVFSLLDYEVTVYSDGHVSVHE